MCLRIQKNEKELISIKGSQQGTQNLEIRLPSLST